MQSCSAVIFPCLSRAQKAFQRATGLTLSYYQLEEPCRAFRVVVIGRLLARLCESLKTLLQHQLVYLRA